MIKLIEKLKKSYKFQDYGRIVKFTNQFENELIFNMDSYSIAMYVANEDHVYFVTTDSKKFELAVILFENPIHFMEQNGDCKTLLASFVYGESGYIKNKNLVLKDVRVNCFEYENDRVQVNYSIDFLTKSIFKQEMLR